MKKLLSFVMALGMMTAVVPQVDFVQDYSITASAESQTGVTITETNIKATDAYATDDGHMVVKNGDKKYFYSNDGKLLFDASEYDDISCNEGIVIAKKAYKYIYLDENGKVIENLRPTHLLSDKELSDSGLDGDYYNEATRFYGGYALVFIPKKGYCIINMSGDIIQTHETGDDEYCKYLGYGDVLYGLSEINNSEPGGIRDIKMNEIKLKNNYKGVSVSFQNFAVKYDGLRSSFLYYDWNGDGSAFMWEGALAYVDDNSDIVLGPYHNETSDGEWLYNTVYGFYDGYAVMTNITENDINGQDFNVDSLKYGYMDKSGKVVISATYDNAYGYGNGLFSVVKDGKCGYIDKNGNEITPLEFDDVSQVMDGKGFAVKNGKVYIISVNPEYNCGDVNEDGTIDALDASVTLAEYANNATGKPSTLTDAQRKAADVNADRSVDALDASAVLGYYAFTATGGKLSILEYLKK